MKPGEPTFTQISDTILRTNSSREIHEHVDGFLQDMKKLVSEGELDPVKIQKLQLALRDLEKIFLLNAFTQNEDPLEVRDRNLQVMLGVEYPVSDHLITEEERSAEQQEVEDVASRIEEMIGEERVPTDLLVKFQELANIRHNVREEIIRHYEEKREEKKRLLDEESIAALRSQLVREIDNLEIDRNDALQEIGSEIDIKHAILDWLNELIRKLRPILSRALLRRVYSNQKIKHIRSRVVFDVERDAKTYALIWTTLISLFVAGICSATPIIIENKFYENRTTSDLVVWFLISIALVALASGGTYTYSRRKELLNEYEKELQRMRRTGYIYSGTPLSTVLRQNHEGEPVDVDSQSTRNIPDVLETVPGDVGTPSVDAQEQAQQPVEEVAEEEAEVDVGAGR